MTKYAKQAEVCKTTKMHTKLKHKYNSNKNREFISTKD